MPTEGIAAAEIIAVGSELLTPYRTDTNSLFLTEKLNEMGMDVVGKSVVGDDRERLKKVLSDALGRADLVICCGGLGPTEDDVTREAVVALLARKLTRDDALLRQIQARFHARGLKMPSNNERQAMVPEGATPLENRLGTAPGLWLETGSKIVLLLPGPPHELKDVFERECLPRLKPRARLVRMVTRVLMVTGLTESDTDDRIAPIYKQYDNPTVTILAAPREIQIHLRGKGTTEQEAQALVDELAERITEKLGKYVFSQNGAKLEEVVGQQLLLARKTVAVAESCTGGQVAQRLTNIPGSSAYFLGGIVCYSNDAKVLWADVPANLIETKGAVSEEVACALAAGIRKRTSADYGIGVTGIAGPSGATPSKPVGLVYIAVADAQKTEARMHHFPGDRDRVRRQACQAALDMFRRRLLGS